LTVIDADAHVHEPDRTWDFCEAEDRQYMPQVIPPNGGPGDQLSRWVVDGTVLEHGTNAGAATPRAYRELEDIEGRLAHMDKLGIDIQVLYPSLLQSAAERPEVEGAMWRAYNRWIADACARSQGRLKWVCRVPLTTMDAAVAELRWAKGHGACGLFLRSIEHERLLSDPFFFPLYEEASALDLPVCVHVSVANPQMSKLYSTSQDGGGFLKFKLNIVGVCHTLLVNGIPAQFPNLRWGMIEATADWVPFVVRELTRRMERRGVSFAPDLLRDNRMFIACQMDDDLPHILNYASADHLVIGTDYGHADNATDLYAIEGLQKREDIDPSIVKKIQYDNACALYGI
jgi:predicted TIM-barrel fold metal-dependent hydrolase